MGVRGAPHAKVPPQMGRDADSAGCRGAKRGRNTAGPSPDGDGDGDGDGYRDKKPRAQRPRMAWEHDIPDGGSGRNSGEDKPRPQMRDGAKPHQPQPEEAQHLVREAEVQMDALGREVAIQGDDLEITLENPWL